MVIAGSFGENTLPLFLDELFHHDHGFQVGSMEGFERHTLNTVNLGSRVLDELFHICHGFQVVLNKSCCRSRCCLGKTLGTAFGQAVAPALTLPV
jgi:hypothetical protein